MPLLRSLTLTGLVLAAAITWWLEQALHSESKQASASLNRPNANITGLILSHYNENGERVYQIQGQSASQDSQNDRLDIKQLDMQTFKTLNTKRTFHIRAQNAHMLVDSEIVHLTGDAQVRQQSIDHEWLTIQSEQLHLALASNTVHSKQKVTINTPQYQLSGIGLYAWLDHDRYQLQSQVQTRHAP